MSSALLRIRVSLARKPIHDGEYAGIVEQGCYPNASPGTVVPESKVGVASICFWAAAAAWSATTWRTVALLRMQSYR